MQQKGVGWLEGIGDDASPQLAHMGECVLPAASLNRGRCIYSRAVWLWSGTSVPGVISNVSRNELTEQEAWFEASILRWW